MAILAAFFSALFTRRARPEQRPALESDAEAERLKAQILSTRKVTAEDRQRSAAVARRILWGVWAEKFARGECGCSFEAFLQEGR